MADVVYPVVNATVAWSAGQTHLSKGRPYGSDHPLVRERPDLFTGEATGVRRGGRSQAVVETATRAPGEVRRTPRPRKGQSSG